VDLYRNISKEEITRRHFQLRTGRGARVAASATISALQRSAARMPGGVGAQLA
jgi:hypothetical protein